VPVFDPYISVTADKDYIYFPGMAPRRRKHAHIWRDATAEELSQHVQSNVVIDQSDTTFFDEFMQLADQDLMKNLNPTILNAL